jgi:predicted metal-dependent hydrolase
LTGPSDRSPYLEEGLRLFRAGEFFLAHETLEERWIEAPADERDFYQGLIHVAVAFHHLGRENRKGALLQLRKARSRLDAYPQRYCGIDVEGLREFLDQAPARIESGEAVAPPPL